MKTSSVFNMNDYKELNKKVRVANQRIQKLQSRYGEGSWALSDLYRKIDDNIVNGISILTGNIRIDKGMSDIQLKSIEKATNDFLSSKTSTLRGAKQVIRKTKDKIRQNYGRKGEELSDEEVGRLYNLVEDKTFRSFVEEMDPSKVWARLIQAKRQGLGKDEFATLFENIANIKDETVRDYLYDIYDRFMK